MNNTRLASVDVFRAVTMLLMIFVIDLESVSQIPDWIGHARADEDRMGVADIVFPCFMFIIGLSIPLAISGRKNKGQRPQQILLHIVSRSASLIVMGLLIVNLDNMRDQSMLIGKNLWQLLMVVGVVMVWNAYPSPRVLRRISKHYIQMLGVVLLGVLAFLYQGAAGHWMQIHWWGILGLLGWSYGVCAALYLFIGNRLLGLGIAALAFLLLNVFEFVDGIDFRLMISASNYFSVMAGVFCSVLYTQLHDKYGTKRAIGALLGLGILLALFGVLSRPEWGISKIRATPSWVTISVGISLALYALMVVVADIQKYLRWARPIAAGGYATLTCYFALYFFYSIFYLGGLYFPESMSQGALGILKSFLVSLLVIQLTAWVGKISIKLQV